MSYLKIKDMEVFDRREIIFCVTVPSCCCYNCIYSAS